MADNIDGSSAMSFGESAELTASGSLQGFRRTFEFEAEQGEDHFVFEEPVIYRSYEKVFP